LLPLALVELGRELSQLARRDARFERAASLAADLQAELTRLTGERPRVRTRRRTVRRRTPGTVRTTERLLEAFEAECRALGTTLQQVQEQGTVMSSQQLSDLRLGERTRRVFSEAGLLHVRDVVGLSPERAADVPQLTPASVAELRAAIMFAADMAGRSRQRALPRPEEGADLFVGLVEAVNELPLPERKVIVLRAGVGDRVYDRDQVSKVLGCTVEQVRRIERTAINQLLSQPACLETCWRLEALGVRLGLGWGDERLTSAVASLYPETPASYTPLVVWLMREKAELVSNATGRAFLQPQGVAHFDEMVVATLGRYGELPGELLTSHVRAALTPAEREVYPEIEVSERVQLLGPAVRIVDGYFRLPDEPVPGVDDRHIRALNGLIGALQRLGSSRISSLTTEVNRRLPRQYQVSEQYVRAWLTRHPELFTQSDSDRYKLASLDVDILCGLATSWVPAGAAAPVVALRPGALALERVRERIAREIADLLERDGPLPIGRIRSHLYGRYIGLASADAVIARNPQRFLRQSDGLVSLREDDEPLDGDVLDIAADRLTSMPRRPEYWRQS
jgi:hypothetical protein